MNYSQQLEDSKNSLMQQEPQQRTPQHGCIREDGRLTTTQPLQSEIGLTGALGRLKLVMDRAAITKREVGVINPVIPSRNQSGQPRQKNLSQKTEQKPLPPRNQSEVEQFTLALSQACILLRQFGKTPAELEVLRDGFLVFLDDISVPEITKALKIHVNTKNEIPTPKDLRDALDPPQAQLSAAVYVTYRKRVVDGEYLLPSQRAYCAAFEDQEKNKMRGGSLKLREAQKEIATYSKQLEYSGGVEDA